MNSTLTDRAPYVRVMLGLREMLGAGRIGQGQYRAALTMLLEAWDEASHPRGKGGRFIPKGSAEAVAGAQEAVQAALAGKGDPKKLLDHLSILTVKQIHELAEKHGKTAPKLLRAELVSAVQQIVGTGGASKGEEKPAEPAPAAKAQAEAPAVSDNVNHHALRPIHAALASIPKDRRATYTAALSKAVQHMPHAVLEGIHEGGLTGARFHENTRELTEAVFSPWPDLLAKMKSKGQVAAGVYDRGTVHLDGDPEVALAGKHGAGSGKAAGIYAHELMHALDGEDFYYSSGSEWGSAYKAEVTGSRLTHYAATNPQEAFAEFGRVLYTGGIDTEVFAKEFPRCAAYFKAKGLWPAERKSAKSAKHEDIFDERIAIPDGKPSDHADKLKETAPAAIEAPKAAAPPSTPAPKSAPTAPPAAKTDTPVPTAPGNHAAKIKGLLSRITDPLVTEKDMANATAGLDSLSLPELQKVATEVGIHAPLADVKTGAAAIGKRVRSNFGAYWRGLQDSPKMFTHRVQQAAAEAAQSGGDPMAEVENVLKDRVAETHLRHALKIPPKMKSKEAMAEIRSRLEKMAREAYETKKKESA